MTQPYYAVPNRYFVAKSSPYQTPGDLDGKRIGACTGCSHELYLKGELEIPSVDVVLDVQNPEIVTYETEGPGLVAAADGKIDAFLAADPSGKARVAEGLAIRPLDEDRVHLLPLRLRGQELGPLVGGLRRAHRRDRPGIPG